MNEKRRQGREAICWGVGRKYAIDTYGTIIKKKMKARGITE